jgi:hypothetical protein
MLATFLLSFVKAFQTMNFIKRHRLSAVITSWGISTLEISTVTFTVMGGWAMIIPAGIGGSVGVLVAMTFHDRVFKPSATKP